MNAVVCATIFATAVSASAKEGETRTCETKLGGQVVCGDLIIGITLEQYEAGLKKRAEEIRGEEAEKRIELQKLMELTERATSAEKDSLRGQIAAAQWPVIGAACAPKPTRPSIVDFLMLCYGDRKLFAMLPAELVAATELGDGWGSL